MTDLAQTRSTLDRHTAVAPESLLRREKEQIRCLACGHRCRIGEGRRGVCQVRYVENGQLHAPFGYVAALACDPIEKKPFFHVLPGAKALSFGMLGCDLHCDYCQNWDTSQVLRDPEARARLRPMSRDDIVATALQERAPVIVSTYNEPLITVEWSTAVFERAKEHGLRTGFVSNGNATPEVLDWLRPVCDLYKVDLKSFDAARYRELGGQLSNVLLTIEELFARGFWLEVVTLVIPGFNDSTRELREIARFLAEIDVEIPWHVTAFRPQYRRLEPDPTPIATLRKAWEIGQDAGLCYVYVGNVPGAFSEAEQTRCPSCGHIAIERHGYEVRTTGLTRGHCAHCQSKLAGIFE